MKVLYHLPGDEGLYRDMQRALCKKNIEKEWEAYKRKRFRFLSLGLVGIACACLAVAGLSVYKKPLNADSVVRPGYGQDDVSYDFFAENDQGTDESIHMDVSSQAYTEGEAEKRFESYYDELYLKILGNNDSYEEITGNLDFSSIEGYEDVTLSFYTSDVELIGDEGQLIVSGREAGEYEASVYIQMSCGQYQKSYEIPVKVVLYADSITLNEYLIGLEEKNETDKSVALPEEYNGTSYLYYTRTPWYKAAGLVCIAAVLLIYGIYAQQAKVKELCRKRNAQLEADYPKLLSRLMILIRAGLSMKKAWYKIIADYERNAPIEHQYLIREMEATRQEIENGISEREAYLQFGKRCGLPCYIKLGSILEQNLRKGAQGMLGLLESERIMAIENRKQQVKTAGEVAGSKLMMPMMILFALVMAIVMVPAMMSFGV